MAASVMFDSICCTNPLHPAHSPRKYFSSISEHCTWQSRALFLHKTRLPSYPQRVEYKTLTFASATGQDRIFSIVLLRKFTWYSAWGDELCSPSHGARVLERIQKGWISGCGDKSEPCRIEWLQFATSHPRTLLHAILWCAVITYLPENDSCGWQIPCFCGYTADKPAQFCVFQLRIACSLQSKHLDTKLQRHCSGNRACSFPTSPVAISACFLKLFSC